MRAIGNVKSLDTKDYELSLAHAEVLDQREIRFGNAVGAEEIATDPPVCPDRRKQIYRIGVQGQFLPATVNDRQSVQCVNTIGVISVEIYIETRVDRKWLASLKCREE